ASSKNQTEKDKNQSNKNRDDQKPRQSAKKAQNEAANKPAKEEKVAERRKRRDSRRNVRVEKTPVETKEETLAANAEPVTTTEPVSVEPKVEQQNAAQANEGETENRSRSRRSPRHMRAAGQRRKKDKEEENSSNTSADNNGEKVKTEASTPLQEELQYDLLHNSDPATEKDVTAETTKQAEKPADNMESSEVAEAKIKS